MHTAKWNLAFAYLFAIFALTIGQDFSPCAVDCFDGIAQPVSCTDKDVYKTIFDCWRSNCTVRETLDAQNSTAELCGFKDRNDGVVGTTLTFTSMSIALVFVGVHIIAYLSGRPWGWDDVCLGIGTVSLVVS
jgi:hypothetical protein